MSLLSETGEWPGQPLDLPTGRGREQEGEALRRTAKPNTKDVTHTFWVQVLNQENRRGPGCGAQVGREPPQGSAPKPSARLALSLKAGPSQLAGTHRSYNLLIGRCGAREGPPYTTTRPLSGQDSPRRRAGLCGHEDLAGAGASPPRTAPHGARGGWGRPLWERGVSAGVQGTHPPALGGPFLGETVGTRLGPGIRKTTGPQLVGPGRPCPEAALPGAHN